jgi:hypothetical protein
VKDFYNQISLKANDNTLTDTQRKEAVQQCYGIEFSKGNPTIPGAGNVNVPATGMCAPTTLVNQVIGPTATGKSYGQVLLKTNTTITFTIRPTAIETTNYATIFLFTKNGPQNVNDTGARMPGVWFTPNGTRLLVSFISNGQFMEPITNGSLPLNQDTNVTIKITPSKFDVICTGGLTETLTRNMFSPQSTGDCTLYCPGPLYPSFRGVLTNLSLCTFDDAYPSVLDYRPGRTKTAFLRPNNYFFNKKVGFVVELGPYGMEPWGKHWGGAFPDNGQAKWIWSRAGANASNPVEQVGFVYTYMNTSEDDVAATFALNSDNNYVLYVNNSLISQGGSGVSTLNVTLKPGDNLFELFISNVGSGPNPAGVIAICRNKQNSAVLFVTNKDWRYVLS